MSTHCKLNKFPTLQYQEYEYGLPALFSTRIANLLHCGWILSNFTRSLISPVASGQSQEYSAIHMAYWPRFFGQDSWILAKCFLRVYELRHIRGRLFTVAYFSMRSWMSIVESDGPPSWSLDASETGESTKCPWIGVVQGTAGEKIFCPLNPTLLSPSPLPMGILYSPQFRSHQETKMAARRTQQSTSTISWENRGQWTV